MTITQLLDLAKQVRDETVEEANSAQRVGNAIFQIIEFFFAYLTGGSLSVTLDHLYSPKDVFESESDLNSNLPTGAEGIYVVTATGNWYFWNTLLEQWQSGGAYQAPLDIVGELGTSESKVINQKHASEKILSRIFVSPQLINSGFLWLTKSILDISISVPAQVIRLRIQGGYTKAGTTDGVANSAIEALSFYNQDTGASFTMNTLAEYLITGNIYKQVYTNDQYQLIITAIVDKTYWVNSVAGTDIKTELAESVYRLRGKRAVTVHALTDEGTIDFTTNNVFIPTGLLVYVPHIGHKYTTADQTIAYPSNYLMKLYYNFYSNSFSIEDYDVKEKYLDNSELLVCTIRRDVIAGVPVNVAGLAANQYKINGQVIAPYFRDLNVDEGANNDFFEAYTGTITGAGELQFLQAVVSCRVLSREGNYNYRMILCNNANLASWGEVIIAYSYLNGTTTRGEDLRIYGANGVTMLDSDYAIIRGRANGDMIEFLVNIDLLPTGSTSINNIKIKKAAFQKKYADAVGAKYSLLGSSTFTQDWMAETIYNLGGQRQPYAIGGATYFTYSDSVLNLSNGVAGTNDNIIMNQVARIIADKTNNVFIPDVIMIMSGLNDLVLAKDFSNTVGAFAIDLTRFETPADWFANATSDERADSAINMYVILYLLAKNFPNSKIIIVTPQQSRHIFSVNGLSLAQNLAISDNQRTIAKRFGVPVIDVTNESGYTVLSGTETTFSDDGVHPNTAGKVVLKKFLMNEIINKVALLK